MIIDECRMAAPTTPASDLKWFVGPALERAVTGEGSEQDLTTMQACLRSTRLEDCESLLVDPGAFDNLTGGRWKTRMDTILARHGMKSKMLQMARPIGIGAVGAHAQQAAEAVEVPGTVRDNRGV